MKKALLFLLLLTTALQLRAAVGHGYIVVCWQESKTDSIAVHGTFDITHSMLDLEGVEHDDYVTMVVTTAEGEWRYPIDEVQQVVLPVMRPWERITLTGDINLLTGGNDSRKRIVFDGTFPKKDGSVIKFKWQEDDPVWIHMADQEVFYKVEMDKMTADSTFALFKPVEVEKKEMPLYVYYNGNDPKDTIYNQVNITRYQTQTKVNNTEHIGRSGDCATSPTTLAPINVDPVFSNFAEDNGKNIYTFQLQHHPVFFTFLTHNPRLPSVKVKSVTMVADKPISGTFNFDHNNGINLTPLKDGNDSITLYTPYFYDDGWKHTPRLLENSQDSTAAYMVVAPQKGDGDGYLNFKFIFNVEDTLSRIDTTFVKKFKIKKLKPNTFYTIDAEVPDTLFSIVDMGIGDIKFAFRNVESYFERSKIANYGGAMAYGESKTKNSYEGGTLRSNWDGGVINEEFVNKYDCAYQRWRGCWRLPQLSEIDTLFKYCTEEYGGKIEWTEYNGVEGALFTGPSGKRIFLPASDLSSNYWATNREWTEDSLWTDHHDAYGSWWTTYHDINVLELDKNRTPVAYWGKKKMHDPGYVRGVLEYSNDIRSNTNYDGSLILLRHLREYEVDKKNFAITGLVRSVRPWPTVGTNPKLEETGFIFGTDSATLYFNEGDEEHNKTWKATDSLFAKTGFRPMFQKKEGEEEGHYNHLKLIDGQKSPSAYGGTPDNPNETEIKVVLSGEQFLGYLDKHQKYYVREYFMIHNPVTGKNDYYYASKATPIEGFFPHTDKIRWKVGEDSCTFNAHVVGVSTEVVGHVGFILSDSIIVSDNKSRIDYALPTLSTGKLYLSDELNEDGERGGLNDDMTYSLTIGKNSPQNIPFENKYYFARAVFATISEDPISHKRDTTCYYAPDDEVFIVHPLDTIDLGLPSGTLWANLCVDAQYPEDHDGSWYQWNTGPALNPLISDISGTAHDETFRDWFGREGWTFAMPSKVQMDELMDNCSFDHVTRFGRSVVRISGPNSKEVNGVGNVLYIPSHQGCENGGWHSTAWTSTRPMKDYVNAYWNMCTNKSWHRQYLSNMESSMHIRPLLQVIGKTAADELIFVSTDTIGNNQQEPEKISFWGRELGVTPAMKTKYTSITRGFLVDVEKWYEFGDKFGRMPAVNLTDTTKKDSIFNGLYSVRFPVEDIERIDANKEYWYRAWICVNGEYFYGVPKLLPTTEIHMKHRDWEVHGKQATLYSQLDGMVYVKDKLTAKTGFIVGKTPDVDLEHYDQKVYANESCYGHVGENLRIQDGIYSQVIRVAKDTIYWVRAFLEADTKTRLSEARQFGLDYVDLGITDSKGHTMLWANLCVGSGYPEDSCEYYSPGEAFVKAQASDHAYYADSCYIDDYILYQRWPYKNSSPLYQSTDSVILKQLQVRNQQNTKTYSVPYRGARRDTYGSCNSNTGQWIHYSGTKNDAAFVNWGYQNPKFNDGAVYNQNNYQTNDTGYGNLFVEPNYDEWQVLLNQCRWEEYLEDDVNGWLVTGPNGNSIFLPNRGYRTSNITGVSGNRLTWEDHWYGNLDGGSYHIADTTFMVQRSRSGVYYSSGDYRNGHLVRPVARYNLPLTKSHAKLRDETLAYLATDTVTYMEERTAVALRGDFRINWPMASNQYELGFIIGENPNVMIGDANSINATNIVRNGSQYFVVLDKDNNLIGDKTYYYRFYLKILDENLPFYNVGDNSDQHVYYANTDTFHLGRMKTGEVEYQIYGETATMYGHVQGIMPGEVEGQNAVKAGILLSYDRNKLTVDEKLISEGGKLIVNDDCSDQLITSGNAGQYNGAFHSTYTIPDEAPDTTYYFRAYATYNGKTHYGDVNVWGYEMVDLGLPSGKKWASINVGGANSLTGKEYSWIGNERHGVGEYNDPDRVYRESGPGGINDHAHLQWVNVSRMSRKDEMEELINECDWRPDTIHGVPGVTARSKTNGRSIFFRNIVYRDGVTKSNTHYTTQADHMYIYESNDTVNYQKPGFPWSRPYYGCYAQYLLRPIWESNIHLDNTNKDELLIRTDDAIIHTPRMDKVTFFGSLLGVTQRRRGGNNYQVEDLHHAGFIIGVDTLVAHKNDVTNENKMYFKYDFPKNNTVTTDSIYYYETANINFFKVDTAYWVRAYVQIGDQYFYGRSIKFVRQPNITTGDVEWKVGQQKATLHGSVVGFNSDVNLKPEGDNVDSELIDIDQVAKNAKVGILVGYKHDVTHADPASERDSSYVLASLTSGNTDFSVTVDYKKDTTYYYRAFIYYNGQYRYGMTGRFGLEFVDLGLPMHWASINVGSRFAEDHSDQFSWGDTEIQDTYRFDDYRHYYATGDDEYNNLGNEIKGTQHDVAHKNWDYTWDEAEYGGRGQLWAMPSEEDLQMLVDSCEWSDSTSYAFNPSKQKYEDVKGFKVYSKKTGRSIFINSLETPEWDIKGNHYGHNYSSFSGPWDYGPLWTSSRAPRERNAYGMEVGAPDGMKAKHLMKYHYRYHGHYVRPMAYINVELPDHDHKKLSITTERTSWVAGEESATIYGCVLGLTDEVKGSFGFVVGNTNDKNQLKVGGSGMEYQYEVKDNSSQNGIFSYTITPLDNHRMYYYRAYLKIGNTYYYDDQINDFGIIEVDLGLTSGTKWANVNMGAWKPKDHGEFYGWGETSTKDVFTSGGYKFYDGVNNTIRELSTNISGNDTTDVAAKTLGGLWRMAGDEEWNELLTECTWTKDTVAHIPGYRVTSKKNTNSIFLPNNYYDPDNRDANYELETREDGYKNHDYEETKYGYYWSSNRASDYTMAREMQFSTEPDVVGRQVTDNARYRGNAIRAVIHPNCGENNKFYLRTEDTDWRYEKDSVNFYAVALAQESLNWGNWYEDSRDYEVGIVIGESPTVTLQSDGTVANASDIKLTAKPSKLGGGDFVATLKSFTLDHNKVYYYCAWLIDHKDNDKVYNAPTYKQFGFQGVSMGHGLTWANINVDAASPEQIGLNGVPTGKYAGVDPAFAEFHNSWRVPTEAEKQELLDETKYIWSDLDGVNPLVLYGVNVWKVYPKENPETFIYLTSKDPTKWGFRAVSQYNIQVDNKTAYLRTDSTNWRAGYSDNNLYASLVGQESLLSSITERGFVLTKTDGEKPATTDVPTDREKFDNSFTASQGQVSASNFFVDMPALPVGTYYYRAYVKIGESYYYADEAKPVGIDFIDLGLSSGVKWANVNIGATVSSDTGDRYAWGETSVKSTFTQANYKYYNSVTKYKDIGADFSGNNTYDAASKLIEGTRMPTQSELNELLTECEWKKDTVNSVPGYRVTSTKAGNTNSIFLPYDRYWTSTQRASDNGYAISLFEEDNNNRHEQREDVPRYQGLMIRPVSASITTLDATPVDKTTATINGVCSVPTENRSAVGFEWTASSNPTNSDWHPVDATFASGTVGTMSADLTGLTEGNIYYFRAFVQMSGESTKKYGTTKYFTTKSTPLDSLKAIDMGMSNYVKWGDRNVGATLPELDGEYYAWGDTLTRLNYNTNTYSHFDKSKGYKSISNNFSASVNDIATRMFEGCWRMPTAAEIQELMDNCDWTWATKEGVPGYWVESRTVDHLKIFLPAAGYKESIDLKNNDINGYYWSATMTGVPTGANAQSLLFSSNSKGVGQGYGYGERYYGFSIRPVYQSNAAINGQDVFIRTDSIVYKADRTENKLYGTMLGLEAEQTDLKQGFVIGITTDVNKDTKTIIKEQTATANGTYFMSLSNEDLKSLLVGEIYYVRAFVAKDGEYRYGNYMEMKDYTFFTDSVKWSLGNSGTLYAHVKAQKSNNLQVGFVYSTDNSEMENGRLKYGKLKTATFETGSRDSIFKATIDTIRVHTYYYQAYTLYDGIYHYGEVKSFGAKLVDLGLPSGIKWVDMNLGADTVDVDTHNNPRVMGDHYRWGDVAPNQTEPSTVPIDVTYIGGTVYDAALRRLGSTYRLPSIDNFKELISKCEWAWKVNGYLVTGPNGNTIFLPLGDYWTSLRGEGTEEQATGFDCETSNTHLTELQQRTEALMLRPIQNPHPDMQGQGGNAGGGVIGGGGGGDVDE